MDERGAIAHLWRRAGFGARPDELDRLASAGYTAAVDRILDVAEPDAGADAVPAPEVAAPGGPKDTKRRRQEAGQMVVWWLRRMVAAERPLVERLTWFWHGHFATSLEKVKSPALMLAQNQLLRRFGPGDFRVLVRQVLADPAMLIWLDGAGSTRAHPNENLGRELLELFTLGHGAYAEADVQAAARALTGWRLRRGALAAVFDARHHDDGTKTFLGETGALTGDDIVRIAVNRPECGRWIASRVWSRFARPVAPSDPLLDGPAAAFAERLGMRDLVGAVLRSPAFLDDEVRTGLVREPFLWVAAVHRAVDLAPDAMSLRAMQNLGQVPFVPPDVSGWTENEGWLTAASALARIRLAWTVAERVDGQPLADEAPRARVEAAAHLLAVQWSAPTAKALGEVASDPRAVLALALERAGVRGRMISRRKFLAGAGAAAGVAVAGTRLDWWAGDDGSGSHGDDSVLVLVTLIGGNDGLNTVVPLDDSVYAKNRSALGVAAADALPLGEGFGLHPKLPKLHAEWEAGRLAIVHGVGFGDLDRSHFHCMDVWDTADPAGHHGSGWLGRWLDISGDDPLLGVSIGATVPSVLRGERTTGACVQPGGDGLPGGRAVAGAIASLSAVEGRVGMAAAVARSDADLLDVLRETADVRAGPAPTANAGGQVNLAGQLATVAALLGAGLGTRVAAVRIDGFDTHSAQQATHDGLLAELDGAVGGFLASLGAELRDRVVVAVHSEFGRRVEPNANAGTDHGTAGPVFVVGSRVRGGHLGEPPPLDALLDGDLRETIDFRRIYAGLAEGVLATPAIDILHERITPLPLIR